MQILHFESLLFQVKYHIWQTALSFKTLGQVIQILKIRHNILFMGLGFSERVQI